MCQFYKSINKYFFRLGQILFVGGIISFIVNILYLLIVIFFINEPRFKLELFLYSSFAVVIGKLISYNFHHLLEDDKKDN